MNEWNPFMSPIVKAAYFSLMAICISGAAVFSPGFLFACPLSSEPVDTMTATLYGVDSRQKELLYRWKLHFVDKGGEHSKSCFTDSSGAAAAEDELLLSNGRFVSYGYVRHTNGERAEVRAEGDKIIYRQELGKQKRLAEESYTTNFVAGPSVVPFIRQNWDLLVRGEIIKIRYGVPDLLRSYEFRLSRFREKEKKDGTNVIIKMAASSFFVGFFIDPIFFEFSADQKALRRIVGRTLPVEKQGRKFTPVDADMRFEATNNSQM
ncbi:MAG: hypothetical protein HZA10_04120 [Nitrospirae bacterium]|nr:hypothetical protein [Nitrospirota bacterium]